jgi:zinc protease
LVVVGDFSSKEILTKIKTAFGKIPRGSDIPKVKIKEIPQRGERRVNLKKEAELPLLLIYYHVPNLSNPDSFALDLLTVILASGRSSRLHQDLVYRRRLARRVDADYSRLSVDPTIFSISAQAMPEKDPAEVERAIDNLLEQIRSQPVTGRELLKAKNQVESSFIFSQDSIFGQAMRIGRYEKAARWQLKDRYLAGIRKLTAADLLRVANKHLDPDRRTVGVLIPTNKGSQ